MTLFRLQFAGQIKKAEHREAAGKPIVEVSICRKNKTKPGEPEAYTWVRVTIWEPASFQSPKLVKGSMIAGSGEMIARSYDGKDGRATSIEVTCRSFDIEVSDGSPGDRAPQEPARPTRPTPATQHEDDQPPF